VGLCSGLRSFAEVEQSAAGLLPALEQKLDGNVLNQIAPERLRLPSGRNSLRTR
jgi:hypothetical protein